MLCKVFSLLSPHEIHELQNVFHDLRNRGVMQSFPGDPTRYNCKGTDLEQLPPSVLAAKTRVGEVVGIKQFEDSDPRKYVFFSYHVAGGAVHKHAHYPPEGITEVRCNLIISRSEGGEPVILDHVIGVDEGDLWVFDSHDRHWSTPVIGDKPRMMLSFGYMVTTDWWVNR
jgi:hypothetical protein